MRMPVPKYRIDPDKTAVLIIDMQNDFIKTGAPLEAPEARHCIPKLKNLLNACRLAGIPLVYVKSVFEEDEDRGRIADFWPMIRGKRALIAHTEGAEIYDEIKPQEGDIVIEKKRYSAFYGTELDSILRDRSIDTLIIAGIATHGCCETTARDAHCRDYKVIFLSDGTATGDIPDRGWGFIPHQEAQRIALAVVASHIGQVSSIDQVIEEISGK